MSGPATLTLAGLIILIVMFAFSFIGGLFTPYRQDQTFFSTESMLKEYAGATRNSELRVSLIEGESFPLHRAGRYKNRAVVSHALSLP